MPLARRRTLIRRDVLQLAQESRELALATQPAHPHLVERGHVARRCHGFERIEGPQGDTGHSACDRFYLLDSHSETKITDPDRLQLIEEEISEVPVVGDLFNVLPFLFVDKYDSYDRFGFEGVAGAGGGGFQDFGDLGDFTDIFGDLFGDIFGGGRRGAGGRRGRGQRGADLRYNLEIELSDVIEGFESKIKIPKMRPCDTCSGSGAEPGTRPTSSQARH